MKTPLRRIGRQLAQPLKVSRDAALGGLAAAFFRGVRLTDPDRMVKLAGKTMQRLGPLLREHRIGRANLAAAYPEKSAVEIETILRGVWDNLGRVGAEFAHLDRLWEHQLSHQRLGRFEDSDESLNRFCHLRDDGKPALIFSAHLANWELPALAGTAFGLDTAVLYRRPKLGPVAEAVARVRSSGMGTLIPTGLAAPVKLLRVLEAGGHVGLLVDQHSEQGVDVSFFGRRCKANPLIAQLARHAECSIHGSRSIRRPGNEFRLELTEAITPARESDGRIDIGGTMQVITSVVEGWVREHPEQWLWVHRRWR
jgi:KDO2-lipid IV(A) lauroyltransferase